MRTNAELAAAKATQALLQRAAKIGFRLPTAGELEYRYEEQLKEAERATLPMGQPKFQVVK
jgi:hypothetical protein